MGRTPLLQRILAGKEVQTAIDDAKLAALEPDQPMPIGMRHARGLEPETPLQHEPAGFRSSMQPF